MRAIVVALSLLALTVSTQAAEVRSRSGVRASVSSRAQHILQCIIDYVEYAGVHIVSLRGTGPGTVRGSLHPIGDALDINQLRRDVTRPAVPRSVSNGAGEACGAVSGARWHDADNGHWNLGGSHVYAGRNKSRGIQVVEALPDRFKPQ